MKFFPEKIPVNFVISYIFIMAIFNYQIIIQSKLIKILFAEICRRDIEYMTKISKLNTNYISSKKFLVKMTLNQRFSDRVGQEFKS